MSCQRPNSPNIRAFEPNTEGQGQEELIDKISDLANTVEHPAHDLRSSCTQPVAMASIGLRLLIPILLCV